MQQGKVFRNKVFAGIVTKMEEELYTFKYDQEYLKSDGAKAISLTLPLQEKEFVSSYLFPFFANMLAEGSLKEIQCKQLRIDKSDDFSRLLKTTSDNTIGSITIEEIKG